MMKKEFSKRFVVSLLFVFLLAIVFFEASQQLFYIRRFGLANGEEVLFFVLLKNQFFRWLVWLLLTIILVKFVKKKSQKKFTKTDLLQYVGLIIVMVVVAILLISILDTISINDSNVLELVLGYIPFYLYQKGLIFTLGYTAVAIILHLYFTNQQLQIQVIELISIKEFNAKLYRKLSSQIDDNSSVLNIKLGNKRKIIPIKSIYWIEADDYCVKIHTNSNISYSMRSTLKSLEDKLSSNNFLRVHRNALVNMGMAKELDFSNTPKLILGNATEITISKSKIKSVKDFLS